MAFKILYTLPNFVTAGSGRALFEIARRLDRDRFEPSICVAQGGGALVDEVHAAGIELIVAPFTLQARPYGSLASRVRRAAEAFPRFDLWHSFHYLDDYTEPLIARAAGARAWVYTKKNMSWNRRSWALRTRFADAVLVQNSDMMECFFSRPRSFHRKAEWVPRGVDSKRFTPGNPVGNMVENQGRAASGELVVGCVAQLVPVKGHPTLIDAVARLPGLRLKLAGKSLDADYVSRLRQQVRRLGVEDRVEFVGHVADVPGFLTELDIFVLPTWARWRMEGCPVALLEAMASGLPVIATDIPGSRDLVKDGETGRVVPPEDAGALAWALRSLESRERRQQLGQAARRRVEDGYDIEREVADHQRVYARVLTGCRPR